jgi:hypothetical protein
LANCTAEMEIYKRDNKLSLEERDRAVDSDLEK